MIRPFAATPTQRHDKALHDFLYERKRLVRRFLISTAILMIVAPIISSFVASNSQSIGITQPSSIIITILAGVMMLLALWFDREETAAFLGVGFGLVVAYLVSDLEQAGIGYGVALYIIYIFIAFVALPDRKWWLAVAGSLLGIAAYNWQLLQAPGQYLG